ncbi:MAG: DUF87 domain-containing protein [Thermoanaerobaculia bacterium]|jgi:hypothetical protein
MLDFDKLGSFYLGKTFDLASGSRGAAPVLYDSKDLTTHGVIVGMTGSGKTGLGLCLLEEALIDNIPVIAVDPKGDLGNLLLTFPQLRPEDFRPWINEQDAATRGVSPDDYAKQQAELWKKGLAEWGQGPERIAKLREAVSFGIYTPGSTAGRPLSVLRSLTPPPADTRDDVDLWRDAVQSTTTGLLSLLGIEGDPLSSRDHILVCNILENAWRRGESLDLAGLIHAIQAPPFDRLGVLDLESFYPSKERFGLAMRVNNLLASPGFAAWLEGEPLDAGALLYGPGGRPRASVINIAHLGDQERMFFMTMLLNRVIAWMRTQPGTTSLRAILYIDEIFGFFPPVANPPSKLPLMRLLKQARAFGLGVVVATQNPVDLDYKGLSNCGTWFIGRLQTERDKERLLDGLEGAALGGKFDRTALTQTLAGVGKRIFLLHNVNESEPVVFETRWAMSYLSGPMSREQIRRLAGPPDTAAAAAPAAPATVTLPPIGKAAGPAAAGPSTAAPIIPPEIERWYLRASGAGTEVTYEPAVLGVADVRYASAKLGVDHAERLALVAEIGDGPAGVEWENAGSVDLERSKLDTAPLPGATWGELASAGRDPKSLERWKKSLLMSLRQDRSLTLYQSATFKETSKAGETEIAFRGRLAQLAREKRDLEAAKLRKKYEPKFTALENRIRTSQQAVKRELDQAKSRKLDATVSIGTAILGSLFGRKKLSMSTASRVGSAVGKMSRASDQGGDVDRAQETFEALQQQLDALHMQMDEEITALAATFDPASEPLEQVQVKPKATDIELKLFGIVFRPMRKQPGGGMTQDW